MLAILTIYSAPAVIEELKTGRAYTLAAFFGDGTKVSESDFPIAFWVNVGLHIAGFAAMSIISVLLLCLLVIEHKRKVTAAAEEKVRDDA